MIMVRESFTDYCSCLCLLRKKLLDSNVQHGSFHGCNTRLCDCCDLFIPLRPLPIVCFSVRVRLVRCVPREVWLCLVFGVFFRLSGGCSSPSPPSPLPLVGLPGCSLSAFSFPFRAGPGCCQGRGCVCVLLFLVASPSSSCVWCGVLLFIKRETHTKPCPH